MLDFEKPLFEIKNKIESLKQSQEKKMKLIYLKHHLKEKPKKYIPILSLGIECKLHVFKKDLRH